MNFLKKHKLPIILTLFCSLLLYAHTLAIGFLSDDWGYVYLSEQYGFLEAFSFLWTPDPYGTGLGNYRPIQSIVSVLFWGPAQAHPWMLHLISILLHGFTAFLVGLLSFSIFKNKSAAYIAGFIFLTTPLNTEVVAWLSSSNSLFATIPLLVALILYAQKQPSTKKEYATVLLLLAFSLLAKEHALVFPAFLVGIDLLSKRRLHTKTILASSAVVCLYIALRIYVLGQMGGYHTATGGSTHLHISFDGILLYAKLPFIYVYNFFNSSTTPHRITLLVRTLSIVTIASASLYILWKKQIRNTVLRTFFILGVLVYIAHVLGWNLVHPFNQYNEHSRILYTATIWVSLLLGCMYNWVSKTKIKNCFILYLVFLPILTIYQSGPWVTAGKQSKQIVSEVSSTLKKHTKEQAVVVKNLPDQYRGAFIFRNGIEYLVALESNTKKYDIAVQKTMQPETEKETFILLK